MLVLIIMSTTLLRLGFSCGLTRLLRPKQVAALTLRWRVSSQNCGTAEVLTGAIDLKSDYVKAAYKTSTT